MNRDDYLSAVSSKVFDSTAKEMLNTELGDHIDEKTDYFIEIGYDDDVSVQKAVASMGDADDVAVQFGQLHSDFYNPVADIILFVLWIALLGGVYYLLNEYVFKDAGMSSLILASSCLSVALMSGYSIVSAYKNKLLPIIFSFFGICATGVFNYFILAELDRKMHSGFSSLVQFVTKTEIPNLYNYVNKTQVIISAVMLCLIAVVVFVFTLIYNIKVRNLNNTKSDNAVMHFFIKLSIVHAIAFFVLTASFLVKCYFDVNKLEREFSDAYKFVVSVGENAAAKEEIIDYIENSGYPFERVMDKEGNLEGYSYQHNLVDIAVNFADVVDQEELRQNYEEAMNAYIEDMRKLAVEYYGSEDYLETENYKRLEKGLKEQYEKYYKDAAERGYYEQEYCNIWLTPCLESFKESYDLISTSFLRMSDLEESEFRSNDFRNMSKSEEFEYYKNFMPSKLNISFSMEETKSCLFYYSYVFGRDEFKHIEDFSIARPDAPTTALYEEIDEIAQAIQDNHMNVEKTAKEKGIAVKLPEISEEEYDNAVKYLGSYFDDIKDSYDAERRTSYVLDNWSFIYNSEYMTMTIYDKYDSLIGVKYIGDEPRIVPPSKIDSLFQRASVNDGYYDRKGYFYSNKEHVPYYTSSGEKFYFYTKTIKDDTGKVGDTKEYYLTDRKSKYYKTESCFIDENGYLCINSGNIKYDEQDKQYKSSDGKICTKALYTSWDKEGNIV